MNELNTSLRKLTSRSYILKQPLTLSGHTILTLSNLKDTSWRHVWLIKTTVTSLSKHWQDKIGYYTCSLWSVWLPISRSCCAPWRARGQSEEERERERSYLSTSTSQSPKTQETLMIFIETPSSLPPSKLTSSTRKLPANVQHERRKTPWMCHMRRTRETEATAQSLPAEADVTLTEQTHNFTRVFLLS